MRNLETDLDTALVALEALTDASTKLIEAGTVNPDGSITFPEAALKEYAVTLVDTALQILRAHTA